MCRLLSAGGGGSAALWNVWWYDESLTRPVPICIRSPLSPPPSLKLQLFDSAQHLSHMRSRPHLEYQMFFPVWGSLLLIIRLSLHIRKILYFTKSCLLYQFPPTPSLPQFTVFYHMNHLSFSPQWLSFLCEIKADSRRAFQPFHEEASSAACRAPFPQATPVTFSLSFLLLTCSSHF